MSYPVAPLYIGPAHAVYMPPRIYEAFLRYTPQEQAVFTDMMIHVAMSGRGKQRFAQEYDEVGLVETPRAKNRKLEMKHLRKFCSHCVTRCRHGPRILLRIIDNSIRHVIALFSASEYGSWEAYREQLDAQLQQGNPDQIARETVNKFNLYDTQAGTQYLQALGVDMNVNIHKTLYF